MLELKRIKLNGEYTVKFSEDFLEVFDSKGREIYHEDLNGYWIERKFDSNNNEVSYEDSTGFWIERKFDSNNKEIYHNNQYGYWDIRENQ